MRLLLIFLLIAVAAGTGMAAAAAQALPVPGPGSAAPAASSSPKVLMTAPPRVGSVEVYGIEKLDKASVQRLAGVAPGQALSHSRREME